MELYLLHVMASGLLVLLAVLQTMAFNEQQQRVKQTTTTDTKKEKKVQ